MQRKYIMFTALDIGMWGCDTWKWCRQASCKREGELLTYWECHSKNTSNLIIWLAELTNLKTVLPYDLFLYKTKKFPLLKLVGVRFSDVFPQIHSILTECLMLGMLKDPWRPGLKSFFSILGCRSPHSSLHDHHIGSLLANTLKWNVLCSSSPQSCFTYSLVYWDSPVPALLPAQVSVETSLPQSFVIYAIAQHLSLHYSSYL